MFKIKDYRIGFDVWGLILFFIIMLPNFVWFAVPAIHDVLRNPSVTPRMDTVASVFQVVMIASLCVIINRNQKKPMEKGFRIAIGISVILYGIGWCLYYAGRTGPVIILDLCITPCLAWILFSLSRKNAVALLSASIFMFCHVLSAILNFIA